MSTRIGRTLPAFTVDAEAALPVEVCRPESLAALEVTGLRGRNVARGPTVKAGLSPVIRRAAGTSPRPASPSRKFIDGFSLLEAAGAELPEQATKAALEGKV